MSGTEFRSGLFVSLGLVPYQEAWNLQTRMVAAKCAHGVKRDVILSLEHPPVFTLGRRGGRNHLRVSMDFLKSQGIDVLHVERGGDITYHGPGQLVVYPILDLRDHGRDVRGYVEGLEEATIRTLRAFGVDGRRAPGLPGVWTDGGKIASIGVHVRRWITMHGLALNVDVEPRHFAMIRPCGLPVRAISICEIAETPVTLQGVTERFLDEAEGVFGWTLESVDGDEIARWSRGEGA